MAASITVKAGTAEKPSLRRAVTPWGSFSWGYSDVGADIFVGLGLVLGAAAGASNVAFLFAGIVYVCIGLAYTELAATYPVAGGDSISSFAGSEISSALSPAGRSCSITRSTSRSSPGAASIT
jgi:amino acid transporter